MTQTAIAVSIVIVLGGTSGVVFHFFCKRFWFANILAAGTSGVALALGALLLVQLTAPDEGWTGWSSLPFAIGSLLFTSILAAAPATAIGFLIRKLKSEPND